MADFIEVAKLDDIPPGRGNCFIVAGMPVAFFNIDGVVFAIKDSCRHAGASLSTGRLEGKIVTCRAHGWRYNVATGNSLNVPDYGVTSYPVRVVDGVVSVDVSDTAAG